MKLSTKSVASLLTAVKRAAERSYSVNDKSFRKLERILRRHDRKGDLQASVLGLDSATYRQERRRYAMDEIIKKYGFSDLMTYFQALYCKLRHELHCRGWSVNKLRKLEMATI